MWLNLVELSVWVREVACSNRVIPIVALAELVMHRIVVPDYAGSNPVGHPTRINSVGRVPSLQVGSRRFESYIRD